MLFDGILQFFDDGVEGFIFIVDIQRFLDDDGLQDTLFLDSQSLFVERTPETIYNHWYDDRLVLFDDVCRALAQGFPRGGGALWLSLIHISEPTRRTPISY